MPLTSIKFPGEFVAVLAFELRMLRSWSLVFHSAGPQVPGIVSGLRQLSEATPTECIQNLPLSLASNGSPHKADV